MEQLIQNEEAPRPRGYILGEDAGGAASVFCQTPAKQPYIPYK
jgi:hypothetical protein